MAAIGVQILAGRNPYLFARHGVVIALLAVSALVFPFFIFLRTPLEFLLVSAVASVSSAAASPGIQVVFARLAPREEMARAFAVLGGASSVAFALALLAGGFLAEKGYAKVFLLSSVFGLVAFGLVAATLVKDRPRFRDPARARLSRRLAAARMDLARSRAALEDLLPAPDHAGRNTALATASLFLFGVSLAIYPVYFPRHLLDEGLPLRWVGAVVALSWLVFGLCQPIGARLADRTKRHRSIIVWSLVAAALLNVVLAVSPLALLVVAWALLGIADGLGRPVTSALIVTSIPDSRHASAFGWTSAADSAARIVAPFAFAFIVASSGIPVALGVAGALVLLSILPLVLITTLPASVPTPAPAQEVPA